MTDNEIKKALECCIIDHTCNKCPLNKRRADCLKIEQYTLDLINRLQAEVKRLENHLAMSKKEIKKCVTHYKMACTERNEFLEQLKTAKAEAYKECIEKVKEYIDTYEHLACEECECVPISKDGLDNLLKEMVGEDK